MNGLMAEIIEGHIRHHVLDPEIEHTGEQEAAAEDVILHAVWYDTFDRLTASRRRLRFE